MKLDIPSGASYVLVTREEFEGEVVFGMTTNLPDNSYVDTAGLILDYLESIYDPDGEGRRNASLADDLLDFLDDLAAQAALDGGLQARRSSLAARLASGEVTEPIG